MLTAAVIALLATPASGAAPSSSLPLTAAPVHLQGGDAREGLGLETRPTSQRVTRPRCASAKRAVAFYRARYVYWLDRMGLEPLRARRSVSEGTRPGKDRPRQYEPGACPHYLAHLLQRKANAARVAFARWHFEQYAWRSWLPEPYRSIFNCETHMNWRHNSGTYQGAPGFHYGTWDAYKPKGYPADAFDATPRQQFIVAQRVAAAVGFGAWGCYR